MSSSIDYYELLGLEPSAKASDVRRAYRRAALATHPDRNPGYENEQTFALVNQAFETLSDEKKRREYDAETGRSSAIGVNRSSDPFMSSFFGSRGGPQSSFVREFFASSGTVNRNNDSATFPTEARINKNKRVVSKSSSSRTSIVNGVRKRTCVTRVKYDDGTEETFEESS